MTSPLSLAPRPGERGKTLFLAVLLLAVGCGKCTKSSASSAGIERVLPRGAVGVVVVPALASAGQKLKIIEALKVTAFAAQLKGFDDGKGFADALVSELGVDVRSTEALEKAGVDGTRAAAFAALVTGHAYLALPVKDEKKLHAALQALATQRLGATTMSEQHFGELTVKTFSSTALPKLGYVIANGYALITDGAGINKLPGLGAMTQSDSLASDKLYAAELEKLPKDRDVVVYLPTGTPLLVQAPFTAVTGSISLTPAGLTVTANASWKGDPAQLAALEPQVAPKSLLGYLPADAFLVTRYSGDPTKLAAWTRQMLGPNLSRVFDEAGFDVKTQVLEQVQPGAVASLSLSERPPMDKGLPTLDLRQTNPFTYVHLSGATATKKPADVVPTLEKIASLAPKFGAEMSLRERPDGQKAMITTYAQGEGVHFAPKGDLLFFASPVQRLDALVKSDGAGTMSLEGNDALAVSVDLNKLSASVRALPESAWGIGGFAIKATTVRWLDATDDLKRVTLNVGAKDKVVQATVVLTLGGAAKPAP